MKMDSKMIVSMLDLQINNRARETSLWLKNHSQKTPNKHYHFLKETIIFFFSQQLYKKIIFSTPQGNWSQIILLFCQIDKQNQILISFIQFWFRQHFL